MKNDCRIFVKINSGNVERKCTILMLVKMSSSHSISYALMVKKSARKINYVIIGFQETFNGDWRSIKKSWKSLEKQ